MIALPVTRSLILATALALSACSTSEITGFRGAGEIVAPIDEPVAIAIRTPEPGGGLDPADLDRIEMLLARYREEGSSAIVVAVPDIKGTGKPAGQAIRQVYAALAAAGVDPNRVEARSFPAADLSQIRIGYYRRRAVAPGCSRDMAAYNLTPNIGNRGLPALGCATQSNIAAMIADPSHAGSAVPMTQRDSVRIADVIDKFKRGERTGLEREEGAITRNAGN